MKENGLPGARVEVLTLQRVSGDSGKGLSRATFGMGCFWSPEARFGALPGVVRTKVGYAGGSTMNPTYKEMGDHTETVQIEFDDLILPYEEIVRLFWDQHNPSNINCYNGRQYQSLLFHHDAEQKAVIDAELERRQREGLGRPDTEILPYADFHPAEERHQKYYVKRYPNAVAALENLSGSGSESGDGRSDGRGDGHGDDAAWTDTTIAARLNGIAKGYSSMERLKSELASWPMSGTERDVLMRTLSAIRW